MRSGSLRAHPQKDALQAMDLDRGMDLPMTTPFDAEWLEYDDDLTRKEHVMAQQMLRLYEYAVIIQPKYDKDGELTDEGKVVVDPKTVLAADETKVNIIAAREIPEELLDKLERVQVVVRPF